ncbi:unnamed protein product [Microthlaspi erraticum]|uniref:FBD domain-containing protein n=1 Tax=Microthlaspi erraticum TaxID=1685480 RepID=A0A6D2JWE9_9BRAS|nr:unnamed protein product [Microthlaspi erraticum]
MAAGSFHQLSSPDYFGCWTLQHSSVMEDSFSGEKGDTSDEASPEVDKDKISKLADPLLLKILSNLRNPRLTSLKVELQSVEGLPTFLEKFPNLKSLSLDVLWNCSMKMIRHSPVPQCLLSSLESVEIYSFCTERPIDMEVARYFTYNSVILKRLVVCVNYMPGRNKQEEDSILLWNLIALPKRSWTCQVSVV